MTSGKEFKTNKNKVMATVLIVVAVIFLVGIIIARAYSLNQGDTALQDVTVPEEDVILPPTEGNIEHVENAVVKDNESPVIDNSIQEQQTFKNVVNKPTNGNTERSVAFTEPTIDKRQGSIKNEGKKAKQNDYYEDTPIQKASKENKKSVEKEQPINGKEEVIEQPAKKTSAFGTVYSSNNSVKGPVKKSDLVKAVIHADQSLGNGQSAIIRLTSDMTLADGTIIPKNSIMYGTVEYGNDRVHVLVKRVITVQKKEMNVALDVYDNDYIKGIYYQTEIDKGVDRGKDESGNDVVNDVAQTPGNGITKGAIIAGKLLKKGVTSASETLKKNRKIKLEEGYILYVKEIKKTDM